MRCDEGNPGKAYDSIEFISFSSANYQHPNVTLDNICFRFGCETIGSHYENFTIQNCEVGWYGGGIGGYDITCTTP